jgi:hypothetical protein
MQGLLPRLVRCSWISRFASENRAQAFVAVARKPMVQIFIRCTVSQIASKQPFHGFGNLIGRSTIVDRPRNRRVLTDCATETE